MEFLDALNDFLVQHASAFEPEIRQIARSAIENSGRRLRPILVYYSGVGPDGIFSEELVRAAAVVEMVHVATLVHDDILDGAEIRRKSPTIYHKHGSSVAVLLGDALFAQALRLASDFPTTEVCREVSQATRAVCAGETRQVHLRGDLNLEIGEYLRIIELKTAELFRVSCVLGTIVAKSENTTRVQAMAGFGKHLGRAYQIFDDAADFVGREETLGKTLGTDLATGKLTLPALLLRDQVGVDDLRALLGKLAESPGQVRETVSRTMVVHDVFLEVAEFFCRELQAARTSLARASLNTFSSEALMQLVDFLEHEFHKLLKDWVPQTMVK